MKIARARALGLLFWKMDKKREIGPPGPLLEPQKCVFRDHITMSEIRTKSYTNFSVNF